MNRSKLLSIPGNNVFSSLLTASCKKKKKEAQFELLASNSVFLGLPHISKWTDTRWSQRVELTLEWK